MHGKHLFHYDVKLHKDPKLKVIWEQDWDSNDVTLYSTLKCDPVRYQRSLGKG